MSGCICVMQSCDISCSGLQFAGASQPSVIAARTWLARRGQDLFGCSVPSSGLSVCLVGGSDGRKEMLHVRDGKVISRHQCDVEEPHPIHGGKRVGREGKWMVAQR
jgi:hypothetical protein